MKKELEQMNDDEKDTLNICDRERPYRSKKQKKNNLYKKIIKKLKS
jgi:uncharacterized protein YifE (UPF0438 family)